MDKRPKQSKAMEEALLKKAIEFVNGEPGDISYPGRNKDHYKKLKKDNPKRLWSYLFIFMKPTRTPATSIVEGSILPIRTLLLETKKSNSY